MSEECSHDCGSCSQNCEDRSNPQDFIKKPHELSRIKKVIGVVSGKGGVGKSLVTALLACRARQCGYSSAVLDADITGPSIPKMFGLKEYALSTEMGILPVRTETGIDIMSLNLIIEDETQPVIWRGPVISGVVEQFWTEVIWGEIDFMFIDMPPGTGDVPLTVFQSIPVDGIVIVATPQELVRMIVEKAVNMANMMDIPIFGIVENMSYLKCPDCGREIKLFGESHAHEIAKEFDIPIIGRIPVDPEIASLCDKGRVEDVKGDWLEDFEPVLRTLKNMSGDEDNAPFRIAVAYDGGNVFQHFGHTEKFKIYTYTGTEITDRQIVDTNGQGHGAIVDFLAEQGVEAVICGGIGSGAKDALSAAGIQVFGGVIGDCDKAVDDWYNGVLNYNPDIACAHHDGVEHNCVEHSCGGCH